MTTVPPLPLEAHTLPDDELGRLLLGLFVAYHAERDGIPPDKLRDHLDVAERITELARDLPDGIGSTENAVLVAAIRLAARGEFAAAGRMCRDFVVAGGVHLALCDIAARRDADQICGRKVRNGGRSGHEMVNGSQDQKEARWREYQHFIDNRHREDSRLKYATLKKEAASHFRVTPRTIGNRTTDPTKKN